MLWAGMNDRRSWRNVCAAKAAAHALTVCAVLLQVLMPVGYFSEKKGNFSCFNLCHWNGAKLTS